MDNKEKTNELELLKKEYETKITKAIIITFVATVIGTILMIHALNLFAPTSTLGGFGVHDILNC